MISIKRAYENAGPDDGKRVLVDRLWPRGISKQKLQLDGWYKDVAPTAELRNLFHHDPAGWGEFKERYFAELDDKPEAWTPLLELARGGNVTFLYGAKDTEHNNAVALKDYLDSKMEGQP